MTAPAQRAAITERLTALAGNVGAAHAFLRALNDNLIQEAADAEAANRRGWKSQKEAVQLVTGRIEIRAGWLEHLSRDAAQADTPCRAVNQDGHCCVRTGLHEAHMFDDHVTRMEPPAIGDNVLRDHPFVGDGQHCEDWGPESRAGNADTGVITMRQQCSYPREAHPAADSPAPESWASLDERGADDRGPDLTPQEEAIVHCGMVYPGSSDPCLLDPSHVDRGGSHQARHSRWPVSQEDVETYEAARIGPSTADVVAYLRGETDGLGMESMFPGLHMITEAERSKLPVIARHPDGREIRGEIRDISLSPHGMGEIVSVTERAEAGPVMGPPTRQLPGRPLSEVLARGASAEDNEYKCECSRTERMYCASKKCHGGADLPEETADLAQVAARDGLKVLQGSLGDPTATARLAAAIVEHVVEGGPMQPTAPDPWANALPVDTGPARPMWMPKPDPRPFALGADCAPPPATVHVTSVANAEQCGLRERLIHRDRVAEQPCWWNVGGTALHMCAEQIERAQLAPGEYQGMSADAAQQWFNTALDHAISMQLAEVGQRDGGEHFMTMDTWRVAGKGTEDEAWWRENGPAMVREYAAWSAQMHADGWSVLQLQTVASAQGGPAETIPALELELHWDVLEGRTDQVWCRWAPVQPIQNALGDGPAMRFEIRIVDPKSGARMPDSNWQLGAYANMLAARLGQAGWGMAGVEYELSACFYDARNGKCTDVIDPLVEYSPDEVLYRSQMVMNMHNTNTYPANPGDGYNKPCGVCYVRYACPIMALRDAKRDA